MESLAKELRAPKGNVFDDNESCTDDSLIDAEVCTIDEAKLAQEIAKEMQKYSNAYRDKTDTYSKSANKKRIDSKMYDAKTGEILVDPSASIQKLTRYGKLFRILAFVVPAISLVMMVFSIVTSLSVPMGLGAMTIVPTVIVSAITALASYMTFDLQSLKLFNRANIEYNALILKELEKEEALLIA